VDPAIGDVFAGERSDTPKLERKIGKERVTKDKRGKALIPMGGGSCDHFELQQSRNRLLAEKPKKGVQDKTERVPVSHQQPS